MSEAVSDTTPIELTQSYSKFFLYSVLGLSIIIPFLVINYQHFPYLGLALSFIGFGAFSLMVARAYRRQRVLLLSAIVIFSIFLVIRVNPLLTFINFSTLIYLTSFLLSPYEFKQRSSGLIQTIVTPIRSVILCLETRNTIPVNSLFQRKVNNESSKLNPQKFPWKRTLEVLAGVAISIVVLAIIIPLLASSNPIFANLIIEIQEFIYSINLLNYLFSLISIISVFELIFRVLVAFILIFLIPKALSLVAKSTEEYAKQSAQIDQQLLQIWIQIPKTAIILILALFIISQIRLYNADSALLTELGYTYGKLVNEVFAQLSIVSGIVFLFIWIDRSRKTYALSTSILLILSALFLLYVATESNLNYIAAWGFTFKRLWGLVAVIWLVGLFVTLFSKLLFHLQHSKIIPTVLIYSIIIFCGVNLANFDRIIFVTNGPRETNGTPYEYYVQLTADSGGLYEVKDTLQNESKTQVELVDEYQVINSRLEYLENKYSKPVFTSFNLSEYLQVKDNDNASQK